MADRPGHDRRYAMDLTAIGRDLGWHPRRSLADGLAETVDWYLRHGDWVDAVAEGGDLAGWMATQYEAPRSA